jgi:hypothetical protein
MNLQSEDKTFDAKELVDLQYKVLKGLKNKFPIQIH